MHLMEWIESIINFYSFFKALHLKEKHFHLQMDKDRLSELVKSIASTEEQDTRLKQQLVARRRQLFLELAEIFPIVQVIWWYY